MLLKPKLIKPLLHQKLIIVKCAVLVHDAQLRVIRIIIALKLLHFGAIIGWWWVLIQVVDIIVLGIDSSTKRPFQAAVLIYLDNADAIDATSD